MSARGVASLAYWLLVGVVAIIAFPIAAVVYVATVAFDRRRVVLHQLTCVWASLYTWMNPLWRVRVEGRPHLDAAAPCVLVANHASSVDIFVLYRLFRHFKWVSKAENFRVPLIGWNMRLNGYIPLRRGDRESVTEMLAACVRTLAQGSSIMMFPEGTRSPTGELRAFKLGAFELSKRAGVAVVPIALLGTVAALPKKGFAVSRAQMVVRVLPAIDAQQVATSTAEALADRAKRAIASQLAPA